MIIEDKVNIKDMFIRASIIRDQAVKRKETISFHRNEIKVGEIDYPYLCAKDKVGGVDFSWVFYPSGQVVVYFRFLNDDDKFNDVTEEVVKRSQVQKDILQHA